MPSSFVPLRSYGRHDLKVPFHALNLSCPDGGSASAGDVTRLQRPLP